MYVPDCYLRILAPPATRTDTVITLLANQSHLDLFHKPLFKLIVMKNIDVGSVSGYFNAF